MSRRGIVEFLRLAALYAGLTLLVVFATPNSASLLIGGVLAAGGEFVRIWAAGHLEKTERLVTSGPYRYTRNPLYLGRLLLVAGLCFAARMPLGINYVVFAVAWVVFFLAYMPRKERIEPARLTRRHGARYEAYRDAVPALIPRLTPWHEAAQTAWSSKLFFRNREMLTVALIALLFALLFLRRA